MKQYLIISFLLLSVLLQAQNSDTLIYENFETGGATFTLNSADENGVSAAIGYNQWMINDTYTGGSGQLICSGFPTTFTVPDTPLQPAGTTGGPASQYMHMTSDASLASGIMNCSYLAANGLCGNAEYNFTGMSQDIITTGYDSITVSFIWLCAGAASTYGEFYYSTDGGLSWNLVTVPAAQYFNQNTWAPRSVSIPTFSGQSSLRFGFRFVNEITFNASDPGFALDEFLITGTNTVPPLPPPVAAFSSSDSAFCPGTCIDFTDLTINSPSSWLWIFPGSTTSFSTVQNPSSICYNAPGTYDVTLIAQNTSGSDTITISTITVYSLPSAPVITASGDTLFATSGYINYEWYLDGVIIPGISTDNYVTISNGNYTVTGIDSNGCSASSIIYLVNTGLGEYLSGDQLVFPNPTSGLINLESITGEYRIIVFDLTGKIVFQQSSARNEKLILDLKTIPAGSYNLNIIFDNGKIRNTRLVKLQ